MEKIEVPFWFSFDRCGTIFQNERKKVKKTKSFKAVRFSGSDMIDDVMDLKPEEEDKAAKVPKKGGKKLKQKEKENSDQETDKEKAKLEKSHSEGILTNAVEVKQTTLQVSCYKGMVFPACY